MGQAKIKELEQEMLCFLMWLGENGFCLHSSGKYFQEGFPNLMSEHYNKWYSFADLYTKYIGVASNLVEKDKTTEMKRSAFYSELQSLIREHWQNREITKVLRDLDDKFITGVF